MSYPNMDQCHGVTFSAGLYPQNNNNNSDNSNSNNVPQLAAAPFASSGGHNSGGGSDAVNALDTYSTTESKESPTSTPLEEIGAVLNHETPSPSPSYPPRAESPPNWRLKKDPNTAAEIVLGGGAFGKVYSAQLYGDDDNTMNSTTPRLIAAKKMLVSPGRLSEQEVRTEAQVMESLIHENIIGYCGLDEDQRDTAAFDTTQLSSEDTQRSYYWILMEHAAKGNLFDQIHSQAKQQESDPFLPPAKVALIVRQSLSSLQYLHDNRQLVHCDLKPSNLLITGDDVIKLADFGSCRRIGTKIYGPHSRGLTPAFIPPEIYRNCSKKAGDTATRVTPAYDIWSFGCVLCAMLVGGADRESLPLINEFLTNSRCSETPLMPLGIREEILKFRQQRMQRIDDEDIVIHQEEKDQSLHLAIDLLLACWTVDPEKRPSAADLLSDHSPFLRLASSTNEMVSFSFLSSCNSSDDDDEGSIGCGRSSRMIDHGSTNGTLNSDI